MDFIQESTLKTIKKIMEEQVDDVNEVPVKGLGKLNLNLTQCALGVVCDETICLAVLCSFDQNSIVVGVCWSMRCRIFAGVVKRKSSKHNVSCIMIYDI